MDLGNKFLKGTDKSSSQAKTLMFLSIQFVLNFPNNMIKFSSGGSTYGDIGPQIFSNINHWSVTCVLQNIIPKLLINIFEKKNLSILLLNFSPEASQKRSKQCIIQ